jgi:hypothetical protein
MAFIDAMRSRGHAVESTCRILREQGCRVAARTYRAWRQINQPVAARTIGDARVIDALLATRGTAEGLYGRRKMTHYLRRQGHEVAFCTVDRLMRKLGMTGGVPRPAPTHPDRRRVFVGSQRRGGAWLRSQSGLLHQTW